MVSPIFCIDCTECRIRCRIRRACIDVAKTASNRTWGVVEKAWSETLWPGMWTQLAPFWLFGFRRRVRSCCQYRLPRGLLPWELYRRSSLPSAKL